jgi:phosphatidylinositol alpha-1,6-mannosyltransferase
MTPTLIITNDFPPTVGGIETFVAEVCRLLDDDVIVLTRHTPGWQEFDRRAGFPVIRSGRLLLPTTAVGRRAAELVGRHKINSVVFGAMAPLALLAPTLRAAGARSLLAISHGHECWWATLPGSRRLLRRMADEVDHVSYISDYTRRRIGPVLSPGAQQRMVRISPPVDAVRFGPPGALQPAVRHGRPRRVLAVGRMVRQKGFDTLLRAWRLLRARSGPDDHAELVLVGDGPQGPALRQLAVRLQIATTVRFTGRQDRDAVAALLRTADVFALPVRTRLGGLYPEGFGLAFAEAAASGVPVVVGRSGGAPETVIDGETGYVVDAGDPEQLADRIGQLLTHPGTAAAMGRAGRDFVRTRYGTETARDTIRSALALSDSGDIG